MTKTELRATLCLASVFVARLLGLFMVYPVFEHYAQRLSGANPVMIGLALGGYGLAQGLLQIPLGALSDRFGRKPVISLGLALFTLGSVVAALSTSIEGVLVGRILQGAGAVGASVLAMVADLTRDEVRTRAMAIVGVSIGLSFALAVVVGPPLAAAVGLSGVFWATAGLGIAGIGVTLGLVPTPVRSERAVPMLANFLGVLRDRELLRLDFAIFALHAVLTASFLVIPTVMSRTLDLTTAGQWEAYLPILAASMVLMIPAIMVAETRGRMKEVFVAAIVAIAASLAVLAGLRGSTVAAVAALTVFFAGFNTMEAMLPSLITRFAPSEAKGAATGVYSSSQFLGIFVGGASGGWLLTAGGSTGVFGAAIALTVIWLLVALSMRQPVRRANRTASSPRGEVGVQERT